jgi:hypothetical protein
MLKWFLRLTIAKNNLVLREPPQHLKQHEKVATVYFTSRHAIIQVSE